MPTVDRAVNEFSISYFPPAALKAFFFCVALTVLVAAGTWLGMRLYLHLFGARTEGKVVESLQKSRLVKGNDFSTPRFVSTRILKIDFTDPEGVHHIVKGKYYSSSKIQRSPDTPRVGGTVQILYCRAYPAFATYYDPIWHYIAPVSLLVIALFLSYGATRICYEDIRNMNAITLADETREHFEEYNKVIIDSGLQIHEDPENPAIYEQRGDAGFATSQFGDAIDDYSEAMRLRPDGRELFLKRAKAEWLAGHDIDALRDWMKYRRQ